MKNNFKKLVSLLLVCTMLLSMVPAVFAEGAAETVEIVMEEVQEIVENEPETEPEVEEPVVEEPVVEEPVVEEPEVEEPEVEEPVVEEPVAEEPVVEEPVVEEPVADEEPEAEEEPVVEEMLAHEYLMFEPAEEGWVVTGCVDPDVEEIIVPSEFGGKAVVAVADGAFAGMDSLRKVIVEEGVITIGSAAFANCEALTLVVLPASLEEMTGDVLDGSPKAVISAPEGSYAATFMVINEDAVVEEPAEAPEEVADDVTEEELAEDYLIMPEALPDAEVIEAAVSLWSATYNGFAEVAAGKKTTIYADVITPKVATVAWSAGYLDDEGQFVADNSMLTISGKGSTATVTAKAGTAGETAFVQAVVSSKDDGEVLAEAIIPVQIFAPIPAVKLEIIPCPWDDNLPANKIVNLNDPNSAVYLKASVVGEEGVEYAHEFTFKSSAPASAEVISIYDEEGYLTTAEVIPGSKPKAGTITITATAADGSGKKATIKVPVAAVAATAVDLANFERVVAVGKSIKIDPIFTPANATTTKLGWIVGTELEEDSLNVVADTTLATISNGTLKAKNVPGLVYIQTYLLDDPAIRSYPVSATIVPSAVSKVTLTGPKDVDVKIGADDEVVRVCASVEPADLPEAQKQVKWTSAKPAVLEIVDTGYNYETGESWADLLPLTVGSSGITAAAVDGSGKKATLTVKVANLATELVAPAGYETYDENGDEFFNEVEVVAGKSLKLGTPTYLPAGAVKPTIKWFVDDLRDPEGNTIYKAADYLTVSSGTIKAKKAPDDPDGAIFRVVAYSETIENAIMWDVRIKPAPASIAITSGELEDPSVIEIVDDNYVYDFDATVIATNDADNEYPDETFTWTSSAKAVATIDNDGKLTVLKPGTTKLTAKGVESKKSGTLTVTIKAPINEFALNTDAEHRVLPGKTLQLSPASVVPSITTDKVQWAIHPQHADTAPFTLTADGLVKGNAGAETEKGALVVAYLPGTEPDYDDLTKQIMVRIASSEKKAVSVEGPQVADINESGIVLTAYEEGREYPIVGTWKSSAAKVVAVDAHGGLKLLAPGTAKITFTAPSGATATHDIKVIRAIQEQPEYELAWEVVAGKSQKITSVIAPSNATEQLFWYVDSFEGEEAPITISADGTTMTAKAGFGGKTATIKHNTTYMGFESELVEVTVLAEPGEVRIVDENGNGVGSLIEDINNHETGEIQLKALDTNTNEETSVTWKSSAEKVATIDENGLIKLVGVGTATITATANNGSGLKDTLKLTVVANANGIISESESEQTLLVGKSVTLKVKADTEEGKTTKQNKFYWTVGYEEPYIDDEAFASRGGKVVTVADGKVTAKAPGRATVLAFVDSREYQDFVEYIESLPPVVMSLRPEEIQDQLDAGNFDGEFAIFNIEVFDVPTKVYIDNGEGATSLKVNKNITNEVFLSYEVQNKFGADGVVNPAGLTWTSSNPSAVRLHELNHEEGWLTLYVNPETKAGSVTITATTNDGAKKKGTFKITTIDGPNGLWIEPDRWNFDDEGQCVVVGGEKLQLTAKVVPATVKNTVKWTVDAKGLDAGAKISSAGVLTTKAVTEPVSFNVTATSTIDTSISCEFGIKVIPGAKQIELKCLDEDNTAHMIQKDGYLDFSTGLTADEGALVYGTSSDWGIAKYQIVNIDGEAILRVGGYLCTDGVWADEWIDEEFGGNTGHAEVSIWLASDFTNAATVQVLVVDDPDSVEIEGNQTLTNGAKGEYVAHVIKDGETPEAIQYVTWYLSDKDGNELSADDETHDKVELVDDNIYDNRVTVQVKNIVVPEAGDEVYLAAYSDVNNGITDMFTIGLSAAAAGIEVDADKEWINMDEGDTITLTATITPSYAKSGVEWTVSHPTLDGEDLPTISVSEDGRTATITAKQASRDPYVVTAKANDGGVEPEVDFDLYVAYPAHEVTVDTEINGNSTDYMADSQSIVLVDTFTRNDDIALTPLHTEWQLETNDGEEYVNAHCEWDTEDRVWKMYSGEVSEPTTVYVKIVMTAGDALVSSARKPVTIYPEAVTALSSDTSSSILINANDTETETILTVEVEPEDACPYINWSSSDTDIVSIEVKDDFGARVKLTGKAAGEVTVTAAAADGSGVELVFTVTVEKIDYKLENVEGGLKLTEYIGLDMPEKLEIPSEIKDVEVVELAEGMFKNNTTITEATLPMGVTKVPASLFEGCTSLTTVVLSDNVTVIGQSAFSGCTSLGNMICVAE